MKSHVIRVGFVFALIFGASALPLYAPPTPPAGGGPPPCWPPPCVPVDGGLGFLVAAGVALGAKRAFGAKKNG